MKQEPMGLIEFQERFGTEESCEEHLYHMKWPDGYRCPRCEHQEAYYHKNRRLYQCKKCGYQASLTAGTVFHKTRTPLRKWFWMIFMMSRQKSGVSMLCLQKMLDIKSYKTVWIMGHKIRKAMADRDSLYQLGGLMEVDDAYFGGTRTGKRGRGAEGKSKVVVCVENRGERAGFASMCIVEAVSGEEIAEKVRPNISGGSIVRTDGWKAYQILNSNTIEHNPVVMGSGKNAVNALPWVHTLISNIKGNIRGVYHGIGSKHLNRYLPEFCYRFNRRFWETELFDRLLNACVNTTTITYSELKA